MIGGTEMLIYASIGVAVITALLNIMFALAVYIDAQKLVHEDDLKTVFVPGPVWAIATLFGGVLIAVGYWLVHRSSIAEKKSRTQEFGIKEYIS